MSLGACTHTYTTTQQIRHNLATNQMIEQKHINPNITLVLLPNILFIRHKIYKGAGEGRPPVNY